MILRPREYFTIVRQLEDPNDTNTYYVRSTIRNARTDAIIDTVDLVDRGGQRFTREWQVPADPSGQGFYISITTSVYTDPSYTTRSTKYGEHSQTYLVDKRHSTSSGGYVEVDYAKIRKIVAEEAASIERPQEVDLNPVLRELRVIARSIERIPGPQRIDFSPIEKQLRAAQKEIGILARAIREKPKDRTGDKIAALDNAIRDLQEEIKTAAERASRAQEKPIAQLAAAIEKLQSGIDWLIRDRKEQERRKQEEQKKKERERVPVIRGGILPSGASFPAKPPRHYL